ncbi:hypothetical protein ACTXK7_07390 [Vreelandella alkaliphila]|uniref:hypothetical protein n=1 Tax=Vreelandella alkaliphila TaxID=272774 RepID=UPI003FD6CA9D
MHVVDLSEIALDTYTWRDIRDALKRTSTYPMCEDIASTERLAYAVAFNGLKKLFPKDGKPRQFPLLYDEYRSYLNRTDHRYLDDALRSAFDGVSRLKSQLRDLLISENFAATIDDDVYTHEECIELTERGRALRRQKHLRRLSKKEAGNKLAKALLAVKAFNSDPSERYFIRRVVLFGSLLHDHASDVGDIDISIEIEPHRTGTSTGYASANRPSAHLSKISPYLSLEPQFSLKALIEEGIETLTVFDATAPGRYAAIENRKALAQAINCPALAAHI